MNNRDVRSYLERGECLLHALTEFRSAGLDAAEVILSQVSVDSTTVARLGEVRLNPLLELNERCSALL